jgi:hypothetical protein
MTLMGLSGLNLIVSAQTVPGIGTSTIAILRMLGTVTCSLAATILAQQQDGSFGLGLSPLKAVGVLLGTLAVTSIPVCFDLKTAARRSSHSSQLYLFVAALEGIAAFYLLRC